jgi:hypothetical protein
MREIKFRGWHIEFKKMHSFNKIADQYMTCWALFNNPEQIIPMQYTGLKDKNGVEIYEGDILKQGTTDKNLWIGPVVWNEDSASYIVNGYRLSVSLADLVLQEPGVIKIGNIYENPELLHAKY